MSKHADPNKPVDNTDVSGTPAHADATATNATTTVTSPSKHEVVLSFDNLKVDFVTTESHVKAVKGVTLDVRRGEVLALVGESGSGKSVTSLSAMGLLADTAEIQGKVHVAGTQVIGLPSEKMRRMRATKVAMVFQEPMTALNPVLTIEKQLTEAMEVHHVAYGQAAREKAIELLDRVGIPDAAKRITQYPHQFSGGQRQRIVIAMALACDPEVIIADEPTTALDVTVQAEVLDLLRELKDTLDVAILLITHNMGVVADLADRVAVMFMGELVEQGEARSLLTNPQHPYTQRLLAAVPRLEDVNIDSTDLGDEIAQVTARIEQERANDEVVVSVRDVAVEYKVRRGKFRAVEGANFNVSKGRTTALVGESGSGKSTLAKAVLGLLPIAEGELHIEGKDLTKLRGREAKAMRRKMGVIFQDPAASLDPRFPIGECITEPMVVHKVGDKKSRIERAKTLLDAVKLPSDVINRYPHELSGGQKQRVGIARALSLDPTLLIADEPTSALDVSVQAVVLEMLTELQKEFGFACLFVSHDLAVVDHLADDVVVMRSGKVVEQGPADLVLHYPREEYTRELLAAAPVPDPDLQAERRRARLKLG